MYCKKCGAEISPSDKFCRVCGATQQQKTEKNENKTGRGVKIISSGHDATYTVTCEYCLCKFEYHKSDLGYRPWYPHGFVYCPECKKPLRHRLEYLNDEQGDKKLDD